MKFKTVILASVILIAGCGQQTDHEEKTSESTENANEVKETAPDAEAKMQQGYALPGLKHGLSQSPININSEMAEGGDSHKIVMNFKDEINKVDNLGHTVQLDFKEGSSITADNETFDFIQCHFHTPSEHLIDGLTFPMEMHIVNTMADQPEDATTEYLVISTLFKEGKENKFISEFLNSIPKEEKSSADMKVGSVKLSDLFGNASEELLGQYYYYKGSLTTPPFTESVRWYVSKHIFEASAEQIEAINKIEGNNARHVQALYGRVVRND
jgi:carbonic anhydrase